MLTVPTVLILEKLRERVKARAKLKISFLCYQPFFEQRVHHSKPNQDSKV